MIKLTYAELSKQTGKKSETIRSFFHRNNMSINRLYDVAVYMIYCQIKK